MNTGSKKQQKEKELKSIQNGIQLSLDEHKIGNRQLTAGGDARKFLRKSHEQADSKSKLLYKKENELLSQIDVLTKQIGAIDAASSHN